MELGTHPSHSPVAGLSKAVRQVEKCDYLSRASQGQ